MLNLIFDLFIQVSDSEPHDPLVAYRLVPFLTFGVGNRNRRGVNYNLMLSWHVDPCGSEWDQLQTCSI